MSLVTTEHNNQLLVKALLGVFGDDDATDAVLERMLDALDAAVQEASDEHAAAIAHQMSWFEITPEQAASRGCRPDAIGSVHEAWARGVASRRRSLGRVLSLQHEIQKFIAD